jgi:hypothetical protein
MQDPGLGSALDSPNALTEYRTKMRDEVWVTTLADGRRVQFTYQELLDDGKFLKVESRSLCPLLA